MSVFTPGEITYLQSQQLGRLATVGPDGQPHVVPMAFRYNPDHDTIDVGGYGISRSKKYRDAAANPRIAIVVDDIVSTDPWNVRMIEIRGEAELPPIGGKEILPGFEDTFIRIHPSRIVSFGIDGEGWAPTARSVS
jgi:pyridoxamine 5'-phosphate oxidase family protein